MFRSAADAPRPIVAFTLTRVAECRRLLLTSTSVWSGASPRNVAGAHCVGTVAQAWPRKVERRQARSERLVDLGDAEVLQLVAQHDVDRRRRLQRGTVQTRARNDDLLQGFASPSPAAWTE